MQWPLIAALFTQLYHFVIGDDCYCPLCELDKLPDNCTTIHGHIQMGLESTMPPFEIVEYKLENVTKIVGCITIANSGFTSLSLLSNLEIVQYSQTGNSSTCSSYGNIITIAKNSLLRRLYLTSLKKVILSKKAEYGIYLLDNPSLCITEGELEQFMQTEKFHAPHIQICDPTKNYCRLDNFEFFNDKNIPVGCQVLTDSLVLNGTKEINGLEFQSRLNDIEQILGSITVFESEIASLKFPNLWRVYNFQPDLPVIFLQENGNLSEVEFSNLTSIPYFGNYPDVLYAFSNPLLTNLSLDTCENLNSLGPITFEEVSNSICENRTSSVVPNQDKNRTGNSGGLIVDVEVSGTNSTALSSVGKDGPPENNTKDNSVYRVFDFNLNLSFLFYLLIFQKLFI
ncbi:Protein irld-34 [Caenorhabditis elegans]|uniref:Protein irld-34 n=1 Tax=Caenorhabditis elegans TaxID=6239 RepID=IRL34_CAEEL|nr:Protein irld-34 [Caenorhabditis elegans]Q03599.1 RecName: Full=Protein irld-34 [Caenorhabditis elegans]CAA79559.1 Protein irld-34 [Caenorhabditis elegans]|eukprot:NP_499029.1 Protein irld-34 [Caenorhabditis elegans]